jgi:aryl-alcohol dehydrogenase-like predicted oxidoreductase
MDYVRLGSAGMKVSRLCLGAMTYGDPAWRPWILSEETSRPFIKRAIEHGITFFDTADMYTQGESERLVGEAFRGQRERVVIATKFGYVMPAQKQLVARVKPLLKPFVTRMRLRSRQVHGRLRGTVSQQDFSGAYIERAVEASLRRLKSDYIDVYQLHDPPPAVLEGGQFVEPLERLREQGKIRSWGIACRQPEDALIGLRGASPQSLQVGISVLEQAALDDALPRAAERGVAVIARQVFASGLLTRPVEQVEVAGLDPDPEVAERKRAQLAAYGSIVERSRRTRAEMGLQFSRARRGVSVVLLGISRGEQLDAGLEALRAPALSSEEHALLLASRRPDA